MGTNYYLKMPLEEGCSREDHRDTVHVGKSSAGWEFMFHSVPELGIASYSDWLEAIAAEDAILKDEYGKEIDIYDFIVLVTNKRELLKAEVDSTSHRDDKGHYFSSAEFC